MSTFRPQHTVDLTERKTESTIYLQRRRLLSLDSQLIEPVTRFIREGLVILNTELQILFANPSFIALAQASGEEELIGKRIGEAINCINATLSSEGCGTSSECSACMVLSSLVNLGEQRQDTSATVFRKAKEALHLKVSSIRIQIQEEDYVISVLRPVNQEERKISLERIFYHDILNSAGVLKGLIELLHENYRQLPGSAETGGNSEMEELWNATILSSARIVEEIQAQRDFSKAERNELALNISAIHTASFFRELRNWFTAYELSEEGQIRQAEGFEELAFSSDPVILRRVFINLIKNALEAAPRGSVVVIDARGNPGGVTISVQNQGVMPREVQRSLFRQTFSTKGSGRGFGSYSVKLLTEQYLQGSVSFLSDDEHQTIFKVRLPWKINL
ncbi:sensor histidine kinase [Marispirochaeta aestuarii]|uniref:sensor histidine kinase n=1 Tax=Marispirochaeta aestuarii TaxID=1963862 RepID=UPI0029C70FB2|nr:sensor histidine kinase [Marispirochaeta aestuarii]